MQLVEPSPYSFFTGCGDWALGCAAFGGVRGWHGRPCPVGALRVVRWPRSPPRGPCAVPHLIGNGVDLKNKVITPHCHVRCQRYCVPSGLSVRSTVIDDARGSLRRLRDWDIMEARMIRDSGRIFSAEKLSNDFDDLV